MTAEWIPEPHLGDFLAYDLAAVVARLEAEQRSHRDAPGLTMLRMALAASLPYDATFSSPWRDAWFVRRFVWIRSLVVARLNGDEAPGIAAVLDVLRPLVLEAEALEAANPL